MQHKTTTWFQKTLREAFQNITQDERQVHLAVQLEMETYATEEGFGVGHPGQPVTNDDESIKDYSRWSVKRAARKEDNIVPSVRWHIRRKRSGRFYQAIYQTV